MPRCAPEGNLYWCLEPRRAGAGSHPCTGNDRGDDGVSVHHPASDRVKKHVARDKGEPHVPAAAYASIPIAASFRGYRGCLPTPGTEAARAREARLLKRGKLVVEDPRTEADPVVEVKKSQREQPKGKSRSKKKGHR